MSADPSSAIPVWRGSNAVQRLSQQKSRWSPALYALLMPLLSLLIREPWIAVLGVVAACAYLVRLYWPAMLFLSFIVYSILGEIVSNAIIEHGAFISEQFRFGHYNGSTAVVSILSIFLLVLLHWMLTRACKRRTRKFPIAAMAAKRMLRAIGSIALLAISAYLVAIAWHGPAWDSRLARFTYYDEFPPAFAYVLKAFTYYIVPMLYAGASYFMYISRRAPLWLLVILVSMFPVLFLQGQKFSSFVIIASFALIGIASGAVALGVRTRIGGKLAFGASMAVVLLFISSALGYSEGGAVDPVSAVMNRLTLQGHVWFGIFDIAHWFKPLVPLGELTRSNLLESPSGLDRISYLISSWDYLNGRRRFGISFTMGGTSVAVAAFGLLFGSLVWMLIVSTINLMLIWHLKLLTQGRTAMAFGTLALLPVYYQIALMGNWYDIFDPLLTVYAVLISFGWVFRTLTGRSASRPTWDADGPGPCFAECNRISNRSHFPPTFTRIK